MAQILAVKPHHRIQIAGVGGGVKLGQEVFQFRGRSVGRGGDSSAGTERAGAPNGEP
jgi:hypothetical protein